MSTTVEYILDVETGKAQAGLKRTEQQTKRTTSTMRNMRREARGLSGSMQFVGESAGALAPELSGMADAAMTGASALRGLGRALASGNPYVILATAVITGLIAAYAAMTAATRRNEESQKEFQKAIQETNKQIEESKVAFDNAEAAILGNAGVVNELAFEYQKLTGQISASEAAEFRREQKAGKFAERAKKDLADQRRALFEQEAAQNRQLAAAKKRMDFLKDEGRARDRNAQLTSEGIKQRRVIEAIEKRIQAINKQQADLKEQGQARINAQVKDFEQTLDNIAKETDRQAKQEAAIKAAKDRQSKLQGILNGLQSQAVGLSDRLLNLQIARMSPMQRIGAEYQREIVSLGRVEQEISKQFEAAEEIARSKRDQVLLTQILEEKTRALAQVEALRSEALTRMFSGQVSLAAKLGKTLGKAVGGTIKTQAKASAKATKDATIALKQLQDIVDQANDDQLSALDKINEKEQSRLDTLKKIGKQEGLNTEEAEKAVRARAQREREALRVQQTAQGIGVAETVVRASFDPQALIGALGGAFGPIGSAIAGIATTLSDLGQKDPEEIKEEFRATFEGIAKGLKVVVPLIFEMLPPILFEAAQMIINAIIQLPFLISTAIFKALRDLFTMMFDGVRKFFEDPLGAIAGLFERLFELIMAPIRGLLGGSFMSGGRMLSGQGGLRFTGSNRGLAMLHEGEMVVPRSGQMSSTVARDAQSAMSAQGGGGGVTIVINSAITERSAIDGLVRRIEERFGSFGQSTSNLFGGV
jgi:hypothetical protein